MKGCQDKSFIGFHYIAVHHHLVQNIMSFFNIIHNIQLANILKVFIHGLNKVMDELEIGHFVLLFQIDTHNEIQRSISSVDDFVSSVLYKRAQGLISRQTLSDQLAFQGRPLFDCHFIVVFGQTRLALFVHHQEEFYHLFKYYNLISVFIQLLTHSQCY